MNQHDPRAIIEIRVNKSSRPNRTSKNTNRKEVLIAKPATILLKNREYMQMVLHNYILHQMTENQLIMEQIMECPMDISVGPMDERHISKIPPHTVSHRLS